MATAAANRLRLVAQVSVIVLSDLLWNLGFERQAARLTILERRFLR